MIQIIEILNRSIQGITLPFICKASDGYIYFVKGHSAGRRSLVCEWIAGNLAEKVGLPIAPFTLLEIPEVIQGKEKYRDLGQGIVFGSRKQNITELQHNIITQIPSELQRSVLAFDWWVKNADRTLSVKGGNPNLLWDGKQKKLVMIDHNQAFDRNFNPSLFHETHIFKHQAKLLFNDMFYNKESSNIFEATLSHWDSICSNIPEEWYYADQEQTVDADFDLDIFYQTLERCTANNFWRI